MDEVADLLHQALDRRILDIHLLLQPFIRLAQLFDLAGQLVLEDSLPGDFLFLLFQALPLLLYLLPHRIQVRYLSFQPSFVIREIVLEYLKVIIEPRLADNNFILARDIQRFRADQVDQSFSQIPHQLVLHYLLLNELIVILFDGLQFVLHALQIGS